MELAISSMLKQFEQGRMSRRQLVKHLAALTLACSGTARAGAEDPATAEAPLFEVRGLDHLALRSPDVARARDWYRDTLGMRVTRDNPPGSAFLHFDRGFLAIFQGEQAGLDHFCFSMPAYAPDEVMERLREAGLEARRRGNRVYFEDADGLVVQLAGEGAGA